MAGLPAVVWLGYGVHGNELSSSDAALLTAYHLLAARDDENGGSNPAERRIAHRSKPNRARTDASGFLPRISADPPDRSRMRIRRRRSTMSHGRRQGQSLPFD